MKKKTTVITVICIALTMVITVCTSACTKNTDGKADTSNIAESSENSTADDNTNASNVAENSENSTTDDKASASNAAMSNEVSTTQKNAAKNKFSAEVYPGSNISFDKSTGAMTINSTGVLPWSNWNVQVSSLFKEKGCSLEDVKKIVITEGVTVFNVGDFCSYKNLTEITIPKTAKVIAGVGNFNNPYSRPSDQLFQYFNINKINYGGTKKDWAKIKKDADVNAKKCSINYSVTVPKCSGFEKNKLNNEVISNTIPNTNIECTANLLTGKLTVKGKGKIQQQDQLFYNLMDFLTIMYNDDQSLISMDTYIDEIVIEEGISELGEGVISSGAIDKITLPKSLKAIGSNNFTTEKTVTDVFYNSSKSDWKKVKIASNNNELAKAKMHYK